jgi:hypothetical protein
MWYVIEGQGGLNFPGNRSLWSRLSRRTRNVCEREGP